MIAVISLRSEDEFSIESLTDDLNSAINYPNKLKRYGKKPPVPQTFKPNQR